MLRYLVTSKARRRLLVLLWGEKRRGSVAELAKLADVAFAGAHAELREMQRLQLVQSERTEGREVFFANENHPEAAALRALVASEVPKLVPSSDEDERTRRQLVALGAPLRGVEALGVEPSERMAVLARGVQLARRDSVVARVVPVCVWKLRDSVSARALAACLPRPTDRHAAGFFLELTAALGGDRRLVGVAESLRDRRLTSVRPFFQLPTTTRSNAAPFALAERWGFDLKTDLDAFRSLFDKYVST